MKRTVLLSVLILSMFMLSCTSTESEDVQSPLVGVWELSSAEWIMNDTTIVFPGSDRVGKSIKYYTDGHFAVVGNSEDVYVISGTYTVDGDKYTEVIGTNSEGMSIGEEVVIQFSIENDVLNLKSDWFDEKWKRIE